MKLTLLIDEGFDRVSYLLVRSNGGQYTIVGIGTFSNSAYQLTNNVEAVHLDPLRQMTELQDAAKHYGWSVASHKAGDFPYMSCLMAVTRH